MDDPYAVGRRDFLKVSATAAATAVAGCAGAPGRWRTLTDGEAMTLGAACDRIVPPDADPGAREAGVVDFIDRQLAGGQKDRREIYRRGLEALDRTARRRGAAFADLAADVQTELLREVEQSQVEAVDWTPVEPAAFFRLLIDHTMMGFYGDPRHGGNRGRVSWKMVGLPDPPIRGRLHEAARG
ncbi:MAG: gluconate 2-dehydrogenase subunit 3 family protein [Vicinamibacteria bacterium]